MLEGFYNMGKNFPLFPFLLRPGLAVAVCFVLSY